MLGCLSQAAVVATASLAGLGYFSFWWILLPVFFAGSFEISNGPGFDIVMENNRKGKLGVFPMLLAGQMLLWLAVAGTTYWIAKAINGT